MTPERWAQVQDIFDAAVEIEPLDRPSYLLKVCGSDAELLSEVKSLLGANEESATFLEHPPVRIAKQDFHAPLQAGDRIRQYAVVSLLGEGGMGTVYLALDTKLGRRVALKILPHTPNFLRDRLHRFEQEARTASALSHPNVSVIYEINETETGDHYIAMEYVAGITLRERLKTPIPVLEAIAITDQVAAALSAAHKAGIIHRDIKPENIMVQENGHVKLLDFGIAKFFLPEPPQSVSHTSDTSMLRTEPGMVIGTFKYMAPEQARGASVDVRTDLWSLGVVLHEMLTGTLPFGVTTSSIALALGTQPATTSRMSPSVAAKLERLDNRLLAIDPEARYQSADELIHDLESVRSELSVPSPPRNVFPSFVLRRKPVTAAVLILLLAVAGGLYYRRTAAAKLAGITRDHVVDERRRVIALLPLENISRDSSQEYFSAGMTEEINAQLCKLASLQIISRAAVARYKSPLNLRQIAQELGAGSLVTGSVREDTGRVRVNVQLLNSDNERTIWTEQYDRELKDVFAVQSDIAIRIAHALGAVLSSSEREHIEKRPTENMAAYQLFLQSQAIPRHVGKENLQAIEILQKAVAMDSHFALALAWLSYRQELQSYLDSQHYLDLGIENARRALAIDPNLAEAHFALASGYGLKEQTTKARLSFMKALELNPNFVEAMKNYSRQEFEAGRLDEALYWAARAFRLSPNSENSYYHLAWPLLLLGDDATTERWLGEGEQRFPASARVALTYSALDFVRGRRVDGLRRAQKAAEIEPGNEEPQSLLADLSLMTGGDDAEERLRRLNQTAPESVGWLLPESFRLKYAYLSLQRGDAAKASRTLQERENSARARIDEGSESYSARAELAAVYALRGDTNNALHWLDLAFATGYRDYRALEIDPFFEKLRNNPRFMDITQRMANDIARMRERAKEQLPEIFKPSSQQK